MPPIFTSQTGTPNADLIEGSIRRSDIGSLGLSASGIAGNITINPLGGSDTVKGESILQGIAATNLLVAQGIDGITLVDAGAEGDTFIALGRASGVFTPSGSSNRTIGRGFSDGEANSGPGNDTIRFSGIGENARETEGVGFNLSSLTSAGGRDKIFISGSAISSPFSPISATAYGIQSGDIFAQGNNDTIEITSTARASSDRGTGQGVAISTASRFGEVFGDKGKDALTVTAEGTGDRSVVTGAFSSLLYGGQGNDSIAVSANSISGNNDAIAIGVDNQTVVFGDSGADIIDLNVSASGSGRTTGEGEAYGLRSSSVFGGADNDVISISSTASGTDGASAFGGFFARVDGGDGDDLIDISATATARGNVTAKGVLKSTVLGGAGNDRIVITSMAQTPNSVGGIGAQKSRVRGNSGNDYIQIVGQGSALFDVQDAVLGGGSGSDTIDAGIGSARIVGGGGNDTVILDYFDAGTMTITETTRGIRVSGTQSKSGSSVAWQQDIFTVENFCVGNITYTASDLIDTFAI